VAIGIGTWRRRAKAWSPKDLGSTLGFWLRADREVTLNAGNASAWGDLSGLGRHFTEATADRQPAYEAAGGPGGGPALHFNDDVLTWNGIVSTGANPIALVAVVSNGATLGTTYQHIVHCGLDSTRRAYGLCSNVAGSGFFGNHYWADFTASNQAIFSAGWRVLAAYYDGTNDFLRINGTQVGTSAKSLNLAIGSGTRIGQRIGSLAQPSQFRMVELVGLGSGATLAKVQQVERYLRVRYGI
jgi:hypothetical protein